MVMSGLTLVSEGIFPIIVDKNGQPLPEKPKTGWAIAGTIQGEGKLAGVPSLFVRLAACNLRCIWRLPNGDISICDTAYASFHPHQPKEWPVDDIFLTIRHNAQNIRHVVISGGEPLLQHEALRDLCHRLKEELQMHITIETNATIYDDELARFVDLISLSPKLRNSEPDADKTKAANLNFGGTFLMHSQRRLNIGVIQQWIDASRKHNHDFQLKFVVSNALEELEIKDDFLSKLNNFAADDVMIMPLGGDNTALKTTTAMALEMAVRNGWRFSPRLHIELFGSKTGV
jgi:7-carboxy-7-deazaguanine synthase